MPLTYDLLSCLTASASPSSSSEAASTGTASTPGTGLATLGRSWCLRCEPMSRSDSADSSRCDPRRRTASVCLPRLPCNPTRVDSSDRPYDMAFDGYSLDDKRTPTPGQTDI